MMPAESTAIPGSAAGRDRPPSLQPVADRGTLAAHRFGRIVRSRVVDVVERRLDALQTRAEPQAMEECRAALAEQEPRGACGGGDLFLADVDGAAGEPFGQQLEAVEIAEVEED